MHALRVSLLSSLLVLTLASCSTDSDPTSPREVQFEVNGIEGTPFEVIELRAANAVHRPCIDGEPVFASPYRFVLEDAFLDAQGVFRPTTDQRLSDVQLLLGGEIVPRRVDDPDETTPVHTGPAPLPLDPAVPSCSGHLESGAREVRVDVSGTPGVRFDATLGDLNGTHIVNVGPIPATFFLEDSTAGVFGVFTKLDTNGEMQVRLLVEGEEKDFDVSEAGSDKDVVLKFDF